MAQIPTQTVTVAGTAPTFDAAASGDTAECGAGLALVVRNDSGSPVTVTLATPGNLQTGDPYPDKDYAVPASGESWIPLLPLYRDPADQLAHIAYDSTAGVSRAVVRVP